MQTKKILSFLILSALTFLLAGCPISRKSSNDTLKPDSTIPQQNSPASKRFEETTSGDQTIVDSAIRLAKKYAEVSEEKVILQQKNQGLIAENRRLKDRVAVLEPELKQAKKHLKDADDLLIDMTTELNNWKMQMLGAQDEIRKTHISQMKMLLKIAKAMGVEIVPEQKDNKQSPETSTTGEPNE